MMVSSVRTDRAAHMGDAHVRVEAELGAIHLHTRNTLGSQRLEEAHRILELEREHGPADTLILDFKPPDLWGAPQFVVLHYDSSRKLIQLHKLVFTILGISEERILAISPTQ